MTNRLFNIEPDLKMAKKFLQHVLGSSNQICFQTFKSRDDQTIEPKWKFGTLASCSEWLTRDNQAGAGVYFVVNRCDGNGRSSSNVTKVRALFVDMDGAPIEPILECKLPPQAIIESSPGRYQAFWRCKGVEVGEFTPMQKALIKRFNSDPACKDLGRVMRMAGFWHLKGEPFMSRIYSLKLSLPYDRDALINELGLDVNWTDERAGFDVCDSSNNPPIAQGGRHKAMQALAVSLRKAGLSGNSLHKAVMSENEARCVPPLPEREIARVTSWTNQRVTTAIQRFDPILLVESVTEQCVRSRQTINGNELKKMKLPPIQWIAKDLLSQGLTILAGAPKVGKSWLAQQIGLSVSTGLDACDQFPTNKGHVLHLALEDTAGRVQNRMLQILRGKAGELDVGAYETIMTWDQLPDAVVSIEDWLIKHDKPRLVIIDTFQKIRNNRKADDGVYAKDYVDVGMLHKLAAKHGIGVLLVHHKRKALAEDPMGGVSGSSGITGAADAIWLFDRPDRQQMLGSLQITGRDISDRHYYLRWSERLEDFGWSFAGDGERYEQTDAEKKVLASVMDAGRALSCQEIADATGISRRHVYRIKDSYLGKGYLEKAAGQYGRYLVTADGEEQLEILSTE